MEDFHPRTAMLRLSVLLFFAAASLCGAESADKAWENLIALDAGPGLEPATAQDALRISLDHLDRQEKSLRDFITRFPTDPRRFSARMRLARLLALRAELRGDTTEPAEVDRLMRELEEEAKSPQARADFDFAQLSRTMRRWQGKRPDNAARKEILASVRQFQARHPKDPRIAALLAETATLYEGNVAVKEPLLREANRLNPSPGLKAQIADDIRRIDHVGKPLTLQFTDLDGRSFDIRASRGKPVIVLFFAVASEPARNAFAELQRAVAAEREPVGFVAVSLDPKPEPVRAFLAERKADVPVGFDGKGWNSPLVQRCGVNVVPSAWLLDARGVVRTLDVLENPADLIRQVR
jgi:hypothetical protein